MSTFEKPHQSPRGPLVAEALTAKRAWTISTVLFGALASIVSIPALFLAEMGIFGLGDNGMFSESLENRVIPSLTDKDGFTIYHLGGTVAALSLLFLAWAAFKDRGPQ